MTERTRDTTCSRHQLGVAWTECRRPLRTHCMPPKVLQRLSHRLTRSSHGAGGCSLSMLMRAAANSSDCTIDRFGRFYECEQRNSTVLQVCDTFLGFTIASEEARALRVPCLPCPALSCNQRVHLRSHTIASLQN